MIQEQQNNIMIYTESDLEEDCNFVESLEDNVEWKEYCAECDEYLEEDLVLDFNDPIAIFKKPLNYSLECNYREISRAAEMIIIGKVIQKKSKPMKSFKYSGLKKEVIFCKNFLNNKVCENKQCKYHHSLNDVLFCKSNCKKIDLYEESFYDGKCSKRHAGETLDNFLLRKNIKSFKTEMCFNFYERPSEKVVEKILTKCKHIGVLKVNFKIVNKVKTLQDYLNENSDNRTNHEVDLNDEEFTLLWNI